MSRGGFIGRGLGRGIGFSVMGMRCWWSSAARSGRLRGIDQTLSLWRNPMNRRDFLKAGAASFALSQVGGYVVHAQDQKPLRVGLIGAGWYGKVDLFRLIQVTP